MVTVLSPQNSSTSERKTLLTSSALSGPGEMLRFPHLRVEVHYLALAELRPARQSLRKHSEPKLELLVRNIAEYGCVFPIGVDAEWRVVVGEARVEAARRLGLVEIPAIIIEHLT